MIPPNPFLASIPTSTNLLLARQTPQQPQLCPSPTTAWGPLGPTPTTTYFPCPNPHPTAPPCSGLPKRSVIALTITIPLVLTCIAVVACAIAYRWGNNSNYNSGYDDGRTKGRGEGRREVDREVERARKEQERQKKEREREREREKMWADWRRREAQAVARNTAATNDRLATNRRPSMNHAAPARVAFRNDQEAAEPVRARHNSSSLPQPHLTHCYRGTPLQHHPPTAHHPPQSNNHRNAPTTAHAQPPPSRRSTASQSYTPFPQRNAVPISLASRSRAHNSRRAASPTRAQASVAAERFGNATNRAFPLDQRFEPGGMRGGGSNSGRPNDIWAGTAAATSQGHWRDSSVDGTEGWREGTRRQKPRAEAAGAGAGDGDHEPVLGSNGSPAFGARSPSLRNRSESPRGERSSRGSAPASVPESEEQRQNDSEEERRSGSPDEGPDQSRTSPQKSRARSQSPLSLKSRSELRRSMSPSIAGEEENQRADGGDWPGAQWVGDVGGRSLGSRSSSAQEGHRFKPPSPDRDRASLAGSEAGSAVGRDKEGEQPKSCYESPHEGHRSPWGAVASTESERASVAGSGERE